jgi:hypothetical protein
MVIATVTAAAVTTTTCRRCYAVTVSIFPSDKSSISSCEHFDKIFLHKIETSSFPSSELHCANRNTRNSDKSKYDSQKSHAVCFPSMAREEDNKDEEDESLPSSPSFVVLFIGSFLKNPRHRMNSNRRKIGKFWRWRWLLLLDSVETDGTAAVVFLSGIIVFVGISVLVVDSVAVAAASASSLVSISEKSCEGCNNRQDSNMTICNLDKWRISCNRTSRKGIVVFMLMVVVPRILCVCVSGFIAVRTLLSETSNSSNVDYNGCRMDNGKTSVP